MEQSVPEDRIRSRPTPFSMSRTFIGRQARALTVIGIFSLLTPSGFTESVSLSASTKTGPDKRVAEEAFKVFNPNVPDRTVRTFIDVVSAYGLEEVYEPCIHQLCLESAMNPMAVSKGHAIGLCQITPTTAFDVLHRADPNEVSRMKKLGASSVAWAVDGQYSTRTDSTGKVKKFIAAPLRKKAIEWLNDPENNLILWGHIMHGNLQTLSPKRAFLAYRLGGGGILRYKGDPSDHPYMAGMEQVRKRLQKKKGVV